MVHNNCPPKSIVNNQTWNHGLQADVRGKQYQQHQVMRHEQTALIHALFRRYCYYAVTYVRIAANAIDVHGCVLFNHQRHCVQDYVHSQLITLGCKHWVCYSNSLSLCSFVHLSGTILCYVKTAEHGPIIKLFRPLASNTILAVSFHRHSDEIPTKLPSPRALHTGGIQKIAIYDQYLAISRKHAKHTHIVVDNRDRESSYTLFPPGKLRFATNN